MTACGTFECTPVASEGVHPMLRKTTIVLTMAAALTPGDVQPGLRSAGPQAGESFAGPARGKLRISAEL
jgi:hypothetical protein